MSTTTRTLGDLAAVLSARTGRHLDDARTRLIDYVRAIGLVTDPAGATLVGDEVADALLAAPIPGLTWSTDDPGAGRWRYIPLCGFAPYGYDCPRIATVLVTLSGLTLRAQQVPTCDDCLPHWNDDVQATAIPITFPSARTAAPATTPASTLASTPASTRTGRLS